MALLLWRPPALADSRSDDVLGLFLPAVGAWFRGRFGEATAPQRMGWGEIAEGRSTLICAPTGSGKTLAAFLACLDHLWRTPRTERGVRVLYVSPLKALNEDIARNLEAPLGGILETARARGEALEELSVAVRTGDTPQRERQRQVRRPPDILITTPESLHLLLTSRGREALRTVSHVVVDEIHALCGNKRGVFLSLLLERLEALTPRSFVRVGLSATQRPLEEVARYLGGQRRVSGRGVRAKYEARAVSVVDAGQRKALDLEVSYPGPEGPVGAGSVWPAIEERLLGLIRGHRSTIVFANNRRLVERLAAGLNDRAGEEESAMLARAHHGSLSLESRRQTERDLKNGELAAVVATASLELGIDMGAVDLVAQVESPGGVARALQRVGRAGHVVGSSSKGRLIAKTLGDLLEASALAHAMKQGRVEALRVPRNCLDVLAQQIVACVAVQTWKAGELFDLVRQAYPYRDLTAQAFEDVVKMVAGQYGINTFRDLKPRIGWDRVKNELKALPGSASLALINGGVIPDTGQFPLYLGEDGPRLGELDEEFVLERRLGETFRLGTSTWRIERIEPQRVVVSRAEGAAALHPFWRGEGAGRTAELGEAVGRLSRELSERVDDREVRAWLEREYMVEGESAERLLGFVRRQKAVSGAVPDDRTIVVETYRDEAGELGVAVLTPFGSKRHHALKVALQARLRRRLGVEVACLHGDDGVLIRLPGMDEPPLDLFEGLTGEVAEGLIREELGESALFGLRFRQNAARALLMPRPDPAKRTPLWLQRLRARDLLQAVRRYPDFPIVVESFRECLMDDLDVPGLRGLLDSVQRGEIRVVEHRGEVPSPFASELVFRFGQVFLYEWDSPKRGDQPRRAVVDEEALEPLLDREIAGRVIEPDAVTRVESRLRGSGRPPRSAEEMAERLRRFGDLSEEEMIGPMAGFLEALEAEGRVRRLRLPEVASPERWVLEEDRDRYERAFLGETDEVGRDEAVGEIVRRFLSTRALVDRDEVVERYPLEVGEAEAILEGLVVEGELVRLGELSDFGAQWADRGNLEEVRRLSVALRRKETVAVAPEVYSEFVARRQLVHPGHRMEGETAVGVVLERLEGYGAALEEWESVILPGRIEGFRAGWLESAMNAGWVWRGAGEGRGEVRVGFVGSGFAGAWRAEGPDAEYLEEERGLVEFLRSRGALEVGEMARGSGMSVERVRRGLEGLVRRGVVTADRLDPLRGGEPGPAEVLGSVARSRAGRPRLGRMRRSAAVRAEARFRLLAEGEGSEEESALAWVERLLERYGVLSRETVGLEPSAPAWKELAPWLHRAEMRAEVRRGYFVEGLSGVQYALEETAEELGRLASRAGEEARVWMLNAVDPANVYGTNAPFDVPLLEGGTARLGRSASNFLMMKGGRPILIAENYGKRLTGLGSASEGELREAVGLLPSLAGSKRRVLKVETYNTAAALASPAAPWLLEAGFVRDYPGVAYYAGWS